MKTSDFQIYFLLERIEKLEEKVFKNKRRPVTMGQKLLLLKEMDLIEHLKKSFKTKELFYLFLSIIIDADPSTIKQYLNNREMLEIKENYQFLITTAQNLKLESIIDAAEKKLHQLEKKE